MRAIIYTHSHFDHTGGATVFAGNDHPEIYSHQRLVDAVPDIGHAGRDGADQFGIALPESLFINAGVQLEFGRVVPPTREGYLAPTRTFNGNELSLTVAGVRLQLLYTPGETADTISVWLPDQRALMPGDDFFRRAPITRNIVRDSSVRATGCTSTYRNSSLRALRRRYFDFGGKLAI